MSNFANALDKYFKVTEKGSTVKTEIIAGLTTFMTMAYILIVNPGMFEAIGVPFGAVYIATALSAIAGTLIMGLYAKIPFAQASGMGLNAFFCFSVVFGYGLSYGNALVVVLFSGILFLILTLTGVREKIVECVPQAVKMAIPAGIGIFIAFIGLQKAGIVVADASTLVKIAPLNLLNLPNNQLAVTIINVILTFSGFLAIAVLSKFKVKGAILWGMLGTTVMYYIVAGIRVGATGATDLLPAIAAGDWNPIVAFKDFGTDAVGVVFYEGFKGLFTDFSSVMNFIAILIGFAMVDMFDTIGTLLGTAKKADMLDENGDLPEMSKALFADAAATCIGAVCGTSTVTTYVESSAGISEGGRTGLTSVVVAVCFFIAMFLSPIAKLIPGCAAASALIYVGVLMISSVKDIEFHDPAIAVPAFLTVTMMALTYNISYGIAFGLISHVIIYTCVLIKDAIKKQVNKEDVKRNLHPVTIVLAVLFLINFFFVAH